MSRIGLRPVRRFGLAIAAVVAISLPVDAQESSNGVGTLYGQPITELELGMAAADLQEQLGQLPEDGRRAAALTALIDIRSLARKAEEVGLDESADFKSRLEFLRQRALHNAYFRQEVIEKVGEEDVRARYDREVAATPPENEVSARHILLETEEDAKAVIEELQGGADFAELAMEKSTGPSAPGGGDLGYFTRGRMVPDFEEAAFALDVGGFTAEPVQTQFGWHVIKVEDKRQVQPPAFAEVQDQIRSVLLRERYFEVLQELRADADLEITDPALKEAYDKATEQQQPPAQ
jgi:peptidyl-prolyl cis-trans isomerase C